VNTHRLILAFVRDLNFEVRIESAAQKNGFQVKVIESAEQIAPPDKQDLGVQFAEPLRGRSAVLLDKITQWHPSLIIFDLGNEFIPWEDWIRLVSSVPATRRIPILCFGPHVEIEKMQAAKKAGAKEVVPRSRFVSQLPDLLLKNAMNTDLAEMDDVCQDQLSFYAKRGLEKFNQGEYFKAHDLLEKAWIEDENPGRELYRAILQVAVAYYQVLQGNYNGAAKMFLRLRQWIDPLPESCRGVNVAQLRSEARIAHEAVLNLGPERIDEFDHSLLKPVTYEDMN
jgi:predicted metal-dependent hydrolase